MCPFYPFHVVLLYLCLLLPFFIAVIEGSQLLSVSPPRLEKLREEESQVVTVSCSDCPQEAGEGQEYKLLVMNPRPHIACVREAGSEYSEGEECPGELELDVTRLGSDWSINLTVSGTFLGFTSLNL